MNKLDMFRFGNTRKKKIRLYAIIGVCVLFLALVLLFAVGVFSYRSELVTLRATTQDAGTEFARLGFNLEDIPNVNMIADASFETSSEQSSIEVVSSSASSLFFEPGALEDAGIDYRVAGDSVRVMSIDGQGVMSERFSGTAIAYQSARLGAVREIDDSLGIFDIEEVRDAVEFQNLEYVLTGEGTLAGDASGNMFICDLGEDEASYIAATDKEFFVVTASGKLLVSTDGRNFSEADIPQDSDVLLSDTLFVCASSEVFAAVNDKGEILSVKSGIVSSSKVPCGRSKISGFAADASGFMAVSEDGATYFSEGGIIFNTAGSIEVSLEAEDPIKAVCGAGDKFYILASDGLIFVYDLASDSHSPAILECGKGQDIQLTGIKASYEGKIIATTTDGSAVVISEEDTLAYFASENVVISKIFCISGDKIIYSASGNIYTAKILSELTVDSNIPEDSVIEGDFCFIASEVIPVRASSEDAAGWISAGGAWDIAGSDTDVTCIAREDGDGSCAKLTGSAPGTHILSQKLPASSEEIFREDTFYRIDLELISEGDTGPVDVWIEGDGFGIQGFTIEEPSKTPEDYSFVFAVTDSMLGDSGVRFNIAFKGTGRLTIDEIYLGPDSYSSAGIPEYYVDTIAQAHPYAIRLDNLNFGASGYSAEAFYGHSSSSNSTYAGSQDTPVSCCRSLEDSLKLVSSAGSTPWLVIDSCASSSDINGLLEYLCGTASSEYGGIRIDNGTALAWSRQFETIIIEIGDSEGCLTSDTQRAAYVDCIISMFYQSEYYPEIKDKVIFLDAMAYEGGTMLSGADGHAMDMHYAYKDSNLVYLECAESAYGLARYQSPHITQGGTVGEYISSFSIEGDIDCGRLLTLLTMEEADFVNCFMFDLDMAPSFADFESDEMFNDPEAAGVITSLMSVMTDLQEADELYIEAQEPLSSESVYSVAGLEPSLVWNAYTAEDGSNYVVVTNAGTTQESFLVSVSAFRSPATTLMRYSSEGRLIMTRKFNLKSMRYTIMPGEFIVIKSDPKE
ncbi:MAG: hypothetical protein K5745_08715 [Saccharofermentans sp.]|nr:hypothetical protein [Saccharofermentans sp.]